MRDLAIRITGDNTSARAALRETETAIGGVTKAATAMGSDVEGAGTKAASSFGGVGKAIGLAAGAGVALVGIKLAAFFVESTEKAYELSGVLSDLSDKTGLSTRFLQDLKFVGDQVGVPLETSARAVQTLEQRVVNGGKSIERALGGLGLSITSLREETPDAMFTTIADAIAGIEDPSKRTALAIDLMGKSGAQLVPLLTNFDDLRQGSVHMSDEAVAAFDSIGDAWSRFKNNIVNEAGELIASLTNVRGLLTDTASAVLSIVGLGKDGKVLVDAFYVNDDVNKSLATLGDSLTQAHDKTENLIPPLKSAKDAQAEFDAEFGDSEKKIRAAIKAQDDHVAAVQKLADTLTGKDVAQKVKDLAAAEQLAEKQGGVTAYQQEQLGKQLLTLSQQGAKIPGVLQPIVERAATLSLNSKVAADGVAGLNKELSNFPSYGLQAIPTFDNLIGKSGDLDKFLRTNLGPAIKELPAPPPDPWQAWHDGVSNMLSGPGGLVENMGTTIGSLTHGWDDFWGNLKQTAQNVFDDLVNLLISQFLDPALNAILGRQSAFGSALNNLFHIPAGASASSALSIPGTTAVGLNGAPIGGGTAGGGSALGSALTTIGAYAGPALAVLEFGNLLNDTGLLGQNSFDSRDRDAMIAQLGLGQYGYQYSTDQLEAMLASGQYPQMATGGLVKAQPGGTTVTLAEAGEDEFVVPRSKMGGVTVQVTINAAASVVDERSLSKFADRLLPQIAYALRRERLA
jgi:hypothetical protein